jgi:hypothetical protein
MSKLPPNKRCTSHLTQPALSLIESLDPGTDEDTEAMWLDEAEKRLEAYDAGETQSRQVNDVIAEIKSGLK